MKSIDIDAQNMIRSYIDSIEEYLRKHTRLHPNEIDSLLNEINDFIYIRSGEIATDPDERVHYADVLKAIEECGSPSEICEQYLDQATDEEGERSVQELTSKKIEKQIPLEPSKPKKGRFRRRMDFSEKAKSLYRSSKGFYIYRVGSIFLYAYFLLFVTFYNFIEHTSHYYYEGSSLYIYAWSAQYLSENFCAMLTFLAFVFVLWEGFVIRKWKQNLQMELGIDHSFDDSLITWISRVLFLLGFLKASLLFVPVYLWFTPIWLLLLIIFERQVESPLWKNQIAPWLTSFGKKLASVEEVTGSGIDISFWGRIKPHFNRRETFFTVLLLGVFGLSFFYPMVFLIYMRFRFSEFPELQYYEGYEFGSFSYILIFTFLSIVAVLLPLLAVGLRRTKNTMFVTSSTYQFFYGDFGLILWLIRLVSLKTILLLTSYDTAYRSMSLFITIFLVLLAGSEILFDTYGGSSLRVGLATLFVRFGSSEPLFQSLREASPESKDENQKTVSVGKLTSVEVRTPPPSSEILPPSTTVVTRTPSTAIDAEREVEPSFFTRAGSKVAVTIGNAIIAVLTGIFLVIRILIVTLGMLVISFYEVGLTFVVLVTSYSFDGSYTVPVFQFKELWLYYGASVSFGGFTIWAWHALLLLGIQVFAVSAIQFSGLPLRKPEGIIAKIGKNLNRVFLFVMLLSSVLQLTVFGDSYALIRLALVFGLIVFNELTSWKTREGRKQWQVITLDRPMTSINKDNHSNANEIMTQS